MDARGGFRFGGFGGITITAIDGSNLSLKTDDGWTRTIAVGSSTTITRAGQTIVVGDLKVGDQIVFGEKKATDGSYTITAIKVVLPVVGGQVTAVGTDSITVSQRGGGTRHDPRERRARPTTSTATAAPSCPTSPSAPSLVAEGTLRSDGSLDASAVHAGIRAGRNGVGGGMGPMFRGGPNDNDQDHPGANPSASPATSSSAS